MIFDLCLPTSTPRIAVAYRPRLTVARIQQEVARHYGIQDIEMSSHRRVKAIARARQVAMYLSRQLTPQSYPDIGRRFHRDHTTVMHAVIEIEKRLLHDPELAEDCRMLRERLAA